MFAVHVLAPVSDLEPARHCAHPLEPVRIAYVPATHSEQLVMLVAPKSV